MPLQKAKLTVLAIAFLDVLGIGLVLPILPAYIEHLTHSEIIATSFFAVYSLCGFFAAPVLGALSDRYGRRPILLASLLGTAVGWLIFALGRGSLVWLLVGRVIDGITSGNISTAQSYLVDISRDEKERAQNLGLMGAVFGAGFIVGPAIGAALSAIALTLPFYFAAGFALFSTVAAYFFLPETHTSPTNHRVSWSPFAGIIKGFRHVGLRPLLTAWLFIMLAFSMLQVVFALYTAAVYQLTATQNGLIFSMIGGIVVLNQGFLMKYFWFKYFREKQLELTAVVVGAAAYLSFSLQNLWLMVGAVVLLSGSQALLRVITMSQISGVAPAAERGEMIGVTHSLMFLASIIAPLLGGVALSVYVDLPWLISAGFLVVAFVILVAKHRLLAERPVVTPPF